VRLTVDVDGAPEGFRREIVASIENALAGREVRLCGWEPLCTRPVAAARVAFEHGAARIQLTVEDALFRKTVSRDLELGAMPMDAWPLAIAVGLDELLRASWAEMALVDAPAPPSPPPAPIAKSVASTAKPMSPPTAPMPPNALFAAADGVFLSSGAAGFGASLGYERRLGNRLVLGIAARWWRAFEARSENGTLSAVLFGGGLALHVVLFEKPGAMAFRAVARADAYGVRFSPSPDDDATGDALTLFSLFGDVGIDVVVPLTSHLAVTGALVLAVPIARAEATDDGEAALSVSGIGGEARLGGAILF